MANRVINTILNLRDNMSGGLIRAARNTQGVSREMQSATRSVVAFKNKTVSSVTSAAKSMVKLGTAAAGVVATLAAKTGFSEAVDLEGWNELDNIIVLPYTFNRSMNNNYNIDSYVVKAKSAQATVEAMTKLDAFLNGLFPMNADGNRDNGSFYVNSNNSSAEQVQSQSNMQSLVLGAIAGISLLVEAAMICSIGGLIGIAIGYVGTMVAGKLLLSTTTDVLLPSPIITLGAFLFSVALGVIFGMYPAVKASGLQPVVALRAE